MTVQVKASPSAPKTFDLELAIHNTEGESIFADQVSLLTRYIRNDSKTVGARAQYTGFFKVAAPGSYEFSVAIAPEDPILKTTLIVYEDACTLISVPVCSLS